MRHSIFLVIALLLPFSSLAAGGITIRISKGLGDAQPVAVVPFQFEGAQAPAVDVAAVIRDDLVRSGRFKTVPTSDMLEQPSRGENIRFENWRVLGMESVVVGRVLDQGDRYIIQFQLFDVFRGKQLLGYSIPVDKRYLRRGAHQAADLIYEELTGLRGAFATRIAFVLAIKDGDVTRYQLIVADADGENQRSILRSNFPIMSPTWSPDGNHIAYVSFENNASEIFLQELVTGKREKISSRAGINGAPAFSPDGRKLAVTLSSEAGNPDIWVIDLASRQKKRLTRKGSIDTEAAFSPDGRYVYFTSDRGGSPQVYRISADGEGDPERVTFQGNYNASASVSPDGKLMTMVTQERGRFNVAVMDMNNKAVRILTEGQQDESPSFAPNGSMVIYATREGPRGVLAATSTDGRIQQQLGVQEGDVREPAWGPYPPAEK